MREEFWNLLGFAWIEAISGSVPGTVRLQVRNPQLCDALGSTREYLMVELSGCTELKLQIPLKAPLTDPREISAACPSIRWADESGDVVRIECREDRVLTLRYQSARLSLVEGRAVTVADLRRAGEEIGRMESERGW